MNRFWSRIVHQLTPYVPGEQPKIANQIKLNTNENPYGPSPKVLNAIKAGVNESLRLYPDPNSDLLKEVIADYHNISSKQVFLGNGSDEVIGHIFHALLTQDAPLLFPDISYGFYPAYCNLYGIKFRTVPLTENMDIDVHDYYQPCGGIIFPNPNAPTGCILSLHKIEALLLAQPDRVLVVDEAYIDFGGNSAVPLVNRFPNLLVVQTLSKSRSLAGLRVGFAIGNHELIEALERVKNSFNSYPLDRLAIVGAIASFEDDTYFQLTRQTVIATRNSLATQLQGLGFDVLPSSANFVFARHPKHDAGELALALHKRAIIVRHFRQPRIEQFLRITVGTDAECAALVQALRELVDTAR